MMQHSGQRCRNAACKGTKKHDAGLRWCDVDMTQERQEKMRGLKSQAIIMSSRGEGRVERGHVHQVTTGEAVVDDAGRNA